MLEYIKTPYRMMMLLRRNPSPNDIAFGVCLALFLGFIPFNGSIALLLVVFFFTFRINRIAMLIMLPAFKILYLVGIKNICNVVGIYLLAKADFLTSFWGWLTNLPVIALLGINYTLVTGGLTLSAVLSPAVYFIARSAAVKIGAMYGEKLKTTKFGSWLQSGAKEDKKAKKPFVLRKLKIANIAIVIVLLAAIHFGTGLIVSPMARAFIVEKLNEMTPSRVMVGDLKVWPLTLSVSLKDVKVFDAEKIDSRIAKLESASFALSPLGLLSGRGVISRAHLAGAEFTPDGVYDAGFVPLKGLEEPVTAKEAEKGPWELSSVLATADKNKDLAGRFYQIVKDRFSKKSAEKAIAAKKDAKKITKKVEKLDFGEKVEFKRHEDAALFEIKSLAINEADIYIDKNTSINDAGIKIQGLRYNPDYGTDVKSLLLKGALTISGSSVGGLEIDFDKKITGSKQRIRFNLSVNDLDIAAARPIYSKSLPVYGEKGRLDFHSGTEIDNGEMNSNNKIVLRDQKISPRNPAETIFGVIPVTILCDAINGVDPLMLKFDVTGPVEKPKMKGLEDSLMTLVKPYLGKAVQNKIADEGQKLMNKLFKKE